MSFTICLKNFDWFGTRTTNTICSLLANKLREKIAWYSARVSRLKFVLRISNTYKKAAYFWLRRTEGIILQQNRTDDVLFGLNRKKKPSISDSINPSYLIAVTISGLYSCKKAKFKGKDFLYIFCFTTFSPSPVYSKMWLNLIDMVLCVLWKYNS